MFGYVPCLRFFFQLWIIPLVSISCMCAFHVDPPIINLGITLHTLHVMGPCVRVRNFLVIFLIKLEYFTFMFCYVLHIILGYRGQHKMNFMCFTMLF